MSRALVEALKAKFGRAILESTAQHGDECVVVEPASWLAVHTFLRDDPAAAMDLFVDLCGVDYPDREPRFEVVVHLYSVSNRHRLRVKARVGDEYGDGAEIASLTPLWSAVDWLERETWDLLGIRFVGHPDLRRILMYDEFEGHPLRRDYDAQRTQPLIPYREGPGILDKIAPFGTDEGMPFGRQSHDPQRRVDAAKRPS